MKFRPQSELPPKFNEEHSDLTEEIARLKEEYEATERFLAKIIDEINVFKQALEHPETDENERAEILIAIEENKQAIIKAQKYLSRLKEKILGLNLKNAEENRKLAEHGFGEGH